MIGVQYIKVGESTSGKSDSTVEGVAIEGEGLIDDQL